MSRLWTIGFEMNDTTYEIGEIYTSTPTIVGTPTRTGSYSLELSNGDAIGYNVSGSTAVYIGFGLYINQLVTGTKFVDFYSSSSTLFDVRYAIGGALQATRNGTVLGTSSNALATGGWYYVEIYYLPDESAGTCTIRVNGAEWLTVTGDTKDNSDAFTVIRFPNASAGGYIIYIDDLVINNTAGSVNNSWPGQQKLYLAKVNAAGDATELTPSAGDNYAAVDEVPPNTADYVYGDTATNRDLYNIDDPLAGTETLGSVVVNLVAKLDSGTGNLAGTVKAGTTEDDGDDIALTENWTFYQQTWNVNPDDSAAWEPTDIDTLQIGAEIKA